MGIVPYQKTDSVTKEAVEALIKNKQKYLLYKKRSSVTRGFTLISLIVAGMGIFAFSQVFQLGASHLLSELLTNKGLSIGFLSLIFLYALSLTYKLKEDKAKEDYEDLRKELIQRSDQYWHTNEQWQEREAIFEYLKKEHDINLYYES